MNFDPRASSARQMPNGNGRSRREQEEESFMVLADREIAGCINDIGIPFAVADLQKPNPQQIQRVFEWFAELLMNATRDAVAPAMRAAADESCGVYADIFNADTRDLMGFFVVMRKLLGECGIHDFAFSDLYKPTRERLVKLFSYIINFIRFRESQTAVIDAHFNKAEKTKQRIEVLYSENQDKEEQLMQLERNAKAADAAIRDKTMRSNELKTRLLELKRSQERVSEKLERAREEQSRLKSLLDEKASQTITVRQEAAKLRPYTTQSPSTLEESLRDLHVSLNNDKSHIETLDRRARALQTSADSFTTVTSDIRTCTSLLHELSRDLAAEEATLTTAARNRDALSERSNNVRDVERTEKMLQKQLENVQRRTDKLRKAADDRVDGETKKMAQLREVSEEIRRERAERGREMERRRVRIEQTEKKMADLKENIENEVNSAREEYVKMDSHIRLYIKEMEGSIVE